MKNMMKTRKKYFRYVFLSKIVRFDYIDTFFNKIENWPDDNKFAAQISIYG